VPVPVEADPDPDPEPALAAAPGLGTLKVGEAPSAGPSRPSTVLVAVRRSASAARCAVWRAPRSVRAAAASASGFSELARMRSALLSAAIRFSGR